MPRSRVYRLESFGVPYQIEVEKHDGAQTLSEAALWAALPPFTRTRRTSAPGRRYLFAGQPRRRVLVIDGAPAIPCSTVRAAQDALEGDVALHVAAGATERVFIHAGVVAWQGRALLLPGRTLTGKSTLVAALVAAGATYYSDEYAVLDADGRCHPYPRRLSLRRQARLPRRVRPNRVGQSAIRVAWVLGSRYEPEGDLTLTALTPGRTALLLLDNAIAARLAPERVLATVRRVAEAAEGALMVRGEAGHTAKELLPVLTGQGMVMPSNKKPRGK